MTEWTRCAKCDRLVTGSMDDHLEHCEGPEPWHPLGRGFKIPR